MTTALAKKDKAVDAIVVDDTTPSSKIKTVHDLDKAVSDVQTLKGEGALACWKLGARIGDIYRDNLWKQRIEASTKKPRYLSFESFCKAELGMTPQNALKLVDIAKFYTVEQVRKFGTTKLGLVLEAPKEDQDRILKEKVEKGATKREVEETVRKLKKEKGHRRTAREGAPASAAGEHKRAKKSKPKATVTVANLVGREVVKLYQKPTTKTFELKDLKRAKKLGDQPYGRLELTNSVTQEFYVQESASGELTLVVVTKRDE